MCFTDRVLTVQIVLAVKITGRKLLPCNNTPFLTKRLRSQDQLASGSVCQTQLNGITTWPISRLLARCDTAHKLTVTTEVYLPSQNNKRYSPCFRVKKEIFVHSLALIYQNERKFVCKKLQVPRVIFQSGCTSPIPVLC